MAIYEVRAWCVVPHYTAFDVEAASIDEALEKARIRAHDEYGSPVLTANAIGTSSQFTPKATRPKPSPIWHRRCSRGTQRLNCYVNCGAA